MSYNFLDLINTKKAAVNLSNNHKLSFPRRINVQNFQPKLEDAPVWMVSARHCQGSLTTLVCLKIKWKKKKLYFWHGVQRHKNIQIFLPPRTTDNKLLGILENKETTWKKYSSTKNRIMHAEILYSFSHSLTYIRDKTFICWIFDKEWN